MNRLLFLIFILVFSISCADQSDGQNVLNLPATPEVEDLIRALEQDKANDKKGTEKNDSIEEFLKGKQRRDGFIPFIWDSKEGKIFLEISRSGQDFLYVHSLATGLGSNPVGLDRGQLGDQKVVRFTRIGPKVLLIQRNLRFRAQTKNELEQRAVEQSFAESTIWGGKVVAETGEKFIVDVTELLLSDMHGVIGTLKQSQQGDFSLDKNRSAVYLPSCKAFPKNTELESTLTFSGKKPGRHVRQTAPSPNSVTLRQHHSFIELPDNNYRPRKYDVRSPSLFITFADYASPLDQALEQRWIMRHRLQKKLPGAALSEAVEPIVYYVDAGAPKLIQDALVEGASWWNAAFETAGFKDAFQVKLLPPDVDPLDVRYNVIQWVHRSTRGWSYGGSVVDPRTGEIIKGHVTLGSLRVRQDQLLVNALNTRSTTQCACCGIGGIVEESTLVESSNDGNSLEVALARIRQLSAHEVGHTIGFVHNFAASTYADRASVMDYPAPRVKISADEKLDFSDAYGVGIGEWDKVSVQFAYSELSPEGEADGLNKILNDAAEKKMIFISDSDARPAGAAHPLANLWDNGTDPLVELKHIMKVRRISIDSFDPSKLPAGTTTADIAQYFTPIYLHHRYQLQAAGKLIGGQYYEYGYAGEGKTNKPVDGAIQLEAFKTMLETMMPEELVVSTDLLKKLGARPYSTIRDEEILPTWSGRVFDPAAAAKVAIELTLDELLDPRRLNRATRQFRQDETKFGSTNLINELVASTWKSKGSTPQEEDLLQIAKDAVAQRLIVLTDNANTSPAVRNAAYKGLQKILVDEQPSAEDLKERTALQRKILLFLNRQAPSMPANQVPSTPPGSPIGSER